MEIKTYSHAGNVGDIIFSLPNIKAYSERTNTKAVLYIQLNQPSTIANHPVQNEGKAVMVSQQMFTMLYPLLMAQPYIQNVIAYETESIPEIDFDLDLFRKDYLNLSAGNISQWIQNSYPELRPNLYEPSIAIPFVKNDFIIVNRSHRYNNLFFDYSILKDYDNVWFVGVEKEYKSMALHNPNIKHLIVKDFYELAVWIAGCKLFIGNQSMAFAIAEQLKVKRVLEQFAHAPNVIPIGGEYFITHTNEQFRKSVIFALSDKGSDKDTTQTRQTEASHGC